MEHCGVITRLTNFQRVPKTDRLATGYCLMFNQVIVSVDNYEGELGVYFPVDIQLGEEYCKVNNLVRYKDENGNTVGGYLDPDKRNIRALKLRGYKSFGLFMPLKSLESFTNIDKLKEGDEISVLNKVLIAQKFIPLTKERKVNQNSAKTKPAKKEDKEKTPFFTEHISTKQLVKNINSFKVGDKCIVTLKCHGSSGRTAKCLHFSTKKQNIFQKLFKAKKVLKSEYKVITGSRRVALKDFSKPSYYENNNFRKKWHDFFSDKLKKSEQVFYELVGYTGDDALIMGQHSTDGCDKEIAKKYGKTVRYTYGTKQGECDCYVYRMNMTNEDGYVVEYTTEQVKQRCLDMGVKFVPILNEFTYQSVDDLKEVIAMANEDCTLFPEHPREGVVVRIDSNTTCFDVYKVKSFTFCELEGIGKQNGFIDEEEAQSIQEDEATD